MFVEWIKCQGDVWCKLNTVNLSHPHFDSLRGVYIIWHGGSDAATVKVGQGNIKERLQSHRNNPDIQKFESRTLYVTWAKVDELSMNGVEAFLGNKLSPLIPSIFPRVNEIEVNLPW